MTMTEELKIAKTDIRGYSPAELKEYFVAMGEKPFRAKQVLEWLWKKGAHSFDEMTNLSKEHRQALSERFEFRAIKTDMVQRSTDGTFKFRFTLHDGHKIESVLIPVVSEDRYTVCVSCQVGCSLTCSFCATGRMKRERNLEASEIYDQVLLVNRQCMETYGHPLTNIVYMGMGEPLLAYRPVMDSIALITSPEGLDMAARRITVSTAGIGKMIKKLADDKVRFNLALSLHAADDTKRNEIMPINEQNDLDSLAEALTYFQENTEKDNKVSFEYIAFQNFNDTLQDAKNLVAFSKKLSWPPHINIIEYNAIENAPFQKSEGDQLEKFAGHLRKNGLQVTVRRSRGRDIDAACGQLANKD